MMYPNKKRGDTNRICPLSQRKKKFGGPRDKIGEEEEDKEEENVLDGFRHGLRRIPDPIHVFRLEQGVTGRALVEQKRRHLLLLYIITKFQRQKLGVVFSLTFLSQSINPALSLSLLRLNANKSSPISMNIHVRVLPKGWKNLSNEWIVCVPETRPNREAFVCFWRNSAASSSFSSQRKKSIFFCFLTSSFFRSSSSVLLLFLKFFNCQQPPTKKKKNEINGGGQQNPPGVRLRRM